MIREALRKPRRIALQKAVVPEAVPLLEELVQVQHDDPSDEELDDD